MPSAVKTPNRTSLALTADEWAALERALCVAAAAYRDEAIACDGIAPNTTALARADEAEARALMKNIGEWRARP